MENVGALLSPKLRGVLNFVLEAGKPRAIWNDCGGLRFGGLDGQLGRYHGEDGWRPGWLSIEINCFGISCLFHWMSVVLRSGGRGFSC